MEHDTLASSGSTAPEVESVRPGENWKRLDVRVAPSCQLVDLKAFLASYAVKVSKDGKVYSVAPISHYFRGRSTLTHSSILAGPVLGRGWTLELIEQRPQWEDHAYEDCRWPFKVVDPLTVWFGLEDCEGVWVQWRHTFEPGESNWEFVVPLLVGRDTPNEATKPTEANGK